MCRNELASSGWYRISALELRTCADRGVTSHIVVPTLPQGGVAQTIARSEFQVVPCGPRIRVTALGGTPRAAPKGSNRLPCRFTNQGSLVISVRVRTQFDHASLRSWSMMIATSNSIAKEEAGRPINNSVFDYTPSCSEPARVPTNLFSQLVIQPSFQQIAWLHTDSGKLHEHRLGHRAEHLECRICK